MRNFAAVILFSSFAFAADDMMMDGMPEPTQATCDGYIKGISDFYSCNWDFTYCEFLMEEPGLPDMDGEETASLIGPGSLGWEVSCGDDFWPQNFDSMMNGQVFGLASFGAAFAMALTALTM